MKDSIIQLNNGKNYYVLEEIEYKNRHFILTTECDLEKDKIKNGNTLYLMERKVENSQEIIAEVIDDELATEVTKKIMNLYQENK